MLGVKGEIGIRRAGLALVFGKMVIRKRDKAPARTWVVANCFACGALISRGERNMVCVLWGDGDPGRDEVVVGSRETIVRMCLSCRQALLADTGLEVVLGLLKMSVVLEENNEMSKTGAQGVIMARVVRRIVK